jgi:hypothetical protein
MEFHGVLSVENARGAGRSRTDGGGFANGPQSLATGETPKTCDKADFVLADCLAFLDQNSPDLATVCRAWTDLPEAIRAGILAMVKASR